MIKNIILLGLVVFLLFLCGCGKPIYISNIDKSGVYKIEKLLEKSIYVNMLVILDINEELFPYQTISHFPNLKELAIHGKYNSRQKFEIHDTIYPKLKLDTLTLCFFDFPVFPIQLKHSQIKKLSIAFSNISIIPDSLQYFSNIEYLDLSGNNLNNLPPSLKYMISLKEINLRNNNFYSIPMELLFVPNLKKIDLSNLEGADEYSKKDPMVNQNNIDYLFEIDNLKKLLEKENIEKIIIHVKNSDEAARVRQAINNDELNKKLRIYREPKESFFY